ncbi:MAG: hypothetical protein MK211_01100 [Flavobacteriales bacterium]|nr:hypothetical protein [Flavobacteriales bacterium]
MVRIISFKEREKEDGTPFFLLELQGGIEMVRSKETNQFYATAKRTFITTTFDKETCKSLVGTQMEGRIVKQEVEPYAYVVKETGEELVLTHRWVYTPEEAISSKEDDAVAQLVKDASVNSKNGIPEMEEVF